MTAEVFLDTAYAIALSSTNDHFHQRAVLLADQLEAAGTRLVTTQAVLLEIGNALAKRRYRSAAIQLLDTLERDPNGAQRARHRQATWREPQMRAAPERPRVEEQLDAAAASAGAQGGVAVDWAGVVS